MLTLEILKNMPPHTVFARGEVNEPRLYKGYQIRWVAVRGDIADWALYYHLAYMDWKTVHYEGDKAFTKEIIQELVPCDDEAWNCYRL